MTAVKIALVVLGILSLALGALVLPSVFRSRTRVDRLKELEDIGVQTEARVVSVRRGSASGSRVSVTLEVGAAGGGGVRRTQWMPLGPDLAAGGSFPVVRHPQISDEFEPGTKADVARRRHLEEEQTPRLRRYVTGVGLLGVGLLAAGVLL